MKERGIAGLLAGAGGAMYLLVSGLRGARQPKTGDLGRPLHIPLWVLLFVAALLLAVFGGVVYLMFVNPRMRTQDKATPYRALVPPVPAQIVPVEVVAVREPSVKTSPAGPNPLPDTQQTRRIGQVYYGYYCLFCHGENGRGDGPVGRSYVPTPTDLTSTPVQGLSDEALYRAMLTGVGHHPVLPHAVMPEAPWYIVSYVRSLPGIDH
jgi:mono/diheme cytochrome c family protein